MKKRLLIGAIFCIGFTTIHSQQIEQKIIKGITYVKQKDNWAIKSSKSDKSFLVNEQVITLKLKRGRLIAKDKMIRKNKLGYIDIQVPKGVDVMDYYHKLKEEYGHAIESIDINYYAELGFNPNDTQLNNQWYLDKIHAKQAWDITLGRASVTVAIIDYYFNWNHNDIGRGKNTYENVWLNSGEDRWTNMNNPATGNGVDNDSNSFIDDLKGWDFRNNDNDVRGSVDHGTRVSGIIGAKTNNQQGMAGIAGGNNSEGIKIMGLNVGYGSNAIDMSVVDDAIIYAVDNGAKIINMSFGGPNGVSAVSEAINYAVQNNVIVIACSMNYGYNYVYYPANHPNVIAVGGTDKNNRRASFAQYGQNLDVVAPAVDIYSTALNNNYNSQDGTSFSAPQVAGVAALILSVRPDLTGQQVRNVIEQTAQKVGGYSYVTTSGRPNGTWNQEMGYGLVDAHAAVYAVAPRLSGPSAICNQATYTIENLPAGATVQWTTSSNIIILSGQGSSSVRVSKSTNGNYEPGNISASLSLNNNNIGTASKYIDYVGAPVVESISGPSYLRVGSTGSYTAEPSIVGNGIQYRWYVNPSGASSSPWNNTNSITFYNEGTYNVSCQIISSCGYGSAANMLVTVVRGRENSFTLSPNPATDAVTLQLMETDEVSGLSVLSTDRSAYEIQIWNGMTMLRSFRTNEPTFQIPMAGLPAGLYFVRVVKDGQTYTQKLIKK